METFEYVALFREEERHWWYLGLHDLVIRLVGVESGKWGQPLQILDAGCGTGRLGELMQPFGKVTGCDVHPFALERAHQRGIDSVLQCDLTKDDLGSNRYHLITAMDVLSHRRIPEETIVYEKLYRALREGGCLLLQVPAFELLRGAHDAAVHTRRRYVRAGLVGLLEAACFKVEIASYRLAPFFLPTLLWRQISRRRLERDASQHVESDLLWSDAIGMNQAMAAVVKAENALIRAGFRIPIGTSLFAVARKQDQGAQSGKPGGRPF